ncbi:hypothetical protein J6590_099154 [Homalodisca vitripennis]|nr:hypothetical protein J6590_099154 [Homalodisca vitripennis]
MRAARSVQVQHRGPNKTEPSSDRTLLLMRAARSVQAGLTNKTEPSSDRTLLLMRAARKVQVQHRQGLPTKQNLQAIEPCYSWSYLHHATNYLSSTVICLRHRRQPIVRHLQPRRRLCAFYFVATRWQYSRLCLWLIHKMK